MNGETEYSALVLSASKAGLVLIQDYLKRMGCFSGIYLFRNAEMALSFLTHASVQLLITDLVIPQMDGFAVLERLQKMKTSHPKIIVTASFYSEFMESRAAAYGADYFLIKPIQFPVFQSRVKELLQFQTKEYCPKSKEIYIRRVLNGLGLPPNLKGYDCLQEGIRMVLEDQTLVHAMTKKLYPAIAEKCHTKSQCVERNIRHAIEVTWNKGDLSYIDQLFGYTVDANRGKPTNSAFFAGVADHIRLAMGKID